jgi:sodium/hydrogen antiporter
MAWDHLSINKPHLVYIILGGFTSVFMLCSSIIKERLYIGEATVATICGIIFGPHAANLIDPDTWGNTDQITLEFSRIVLVVQCFAVGVELPKHYMEKHWKSVTLLLVPVMTFGWLITSLFIWAVFHPWANWLDSLTMAACVTATDPVLASSVVGKGKFAKRVPKHLRDLLSAESGCNDGMAFPFIYLALYVLRYKESPNEVALHWFCYTILYECIFGAVYGVLIGYIARRLIRLAHERDYIDRESFLVFYFVLALFCAGSGSLLGLDDLLVGFACGVGFSNDGWFTEKTEESHVSNVIDLLINLAFFVYFGTIIPWEQYNAGFLGLDVWRLVVIAFLVLFFRRIPIMMMLKPIIPDIKTWREALFAGHFGPIGVGAIFVAILARAELEHEHGSGTTPLKVLPTPPFPHRNIIELIWPITTFLVITSIIVHGSSIAVFTLGRHINTLSLTMSFTKSNEPNWMDRLPRIQSRSKSQAMSDSEVDEKGPLPPGQLPGVVGRKPFLRRLREEDNPSRQGSRSSSRHRSSKTKTWESRRGPGGPISQSAIEPQRRATSPDPISRSDSETLAVKSESPPSSEDKRQDDGEDVGEIYEEGENTVYEDEEGNVLAVEPTRRGDQATREREEVREGRRLMHEAGADRHEGVAEEEYTEDQGGEELMDKVRSWGEEARDEVEGSPVAHPERPGRNWRNGLRKMSTAGASYFRPRAELTSEQEKPKPEPPIAKKHGPARAYQFGNTIIIEDEDGEVIKKYDIPAPEGAEKANQGVTQKGLEQMSKMFGFGNKKASVQAGAQPAAEASVASPPAQPVDKQQETEEDNDNNLRFTMGGRRYSTAEFIQEIGNMAPKRRVQAVENSNAPEEIKREARKEARQQAGMQRRATGDVPPVVEQPEYEDGMATVEKTNSHDDNSLKLITSKDEHIPFHDVAADLKTYSMRSSKGESAADRRRREALQGTTEEDSDDDGTERIPPAMRAGPSGNNQETSDTVETAAERRRRLAALGQQKDQESDSEEDDEPRQASQRPTLRFADQPPPQERQHPRQSAFRRGKNASR